jgi:hypothetical protein
VDAKTQERRKWMVAGVLVALAVLLTARALLHFETTESQVPALSTQESAVQDVAGNGSRDFATLDPMLHYALLERTERERYAGRGRNIFRADMEVHTKKVPPPPPTPIPPAPSRQPMLEQIRLKFFGFASIFNSPRRVFLIEGDDIFVATEGEIVNRRYRISRINSDSVQVEDLIEHSVHTLTLAG